MTDVLERVKSDLTGTGSEIITGAFRDGASGNIEPGFGIEVENGD